MKLQINRFGKTKTILLSLCALLLCTLLLAGCDSFIPQNEEHLALCHEMMRHVINNDIDSAYEMVREAGSKQDFQPVFDTLRELMGDSQTYELTQTGWYVNVNDGVTSYTSTFQLDASGGSVILLQIKTVEGISGMTSFYLHDATEFAQNVDQYNGINVVFLCVWIATLAFTVWMLVDCIRRKIKKKALWIILILLGLNLTLTLGEGGINFGFTLGWLLSVSSVKAVIPSLSVLYRLYLPLGAILYLISRNRITKKEEPVLPVTEEMTDTESNTAVGTELSGDCFPTASKEEEAKEDTEKPKEE